MTSSPWSVLLSMAWLALFLLASSASSQRDPGRRGDPSLQGGFVHTFDTREACSYTCTAPCGQENSADLMMPRWICPMHTHPRAQHQEPNYMEMEEESEGGSMPSLAILVPLCILASLLCLFLCVNCTHRFVRG